MSTGKSNTGVSQNKNKASSEAVIKMKIFMYGFTLNIRQRK